MHKPKTIWDYSFDPAPSKHNEPWNSSDEDLLLVWAADGRSIRDIALALNRTEQAAITKYRRLTGKEFVHCLGLSSCSKSSAQLLNDYPKANIVRPPEPAGEGAVDIKAECLCDVNQTNIRDFLAVRSSGELKNHSFYLLEDYEWILVRDSYGRLCLVPLKNKKN